jgi:hypothetical protein
MNSIRNMLVMAVLLFALSANAADHSVWMKALGGSVNDKIYDVVEVDGQLYFAGGKDQDAGDSKAWLFATDPDGNLDLDRVFIDHAGQPVVITQLAASDRQLSAKGNPVAGDRIYAAGNIGYPGAGYDIFLVAFSRPGSIVWQRQLELEGDEVLGDLIATRDGGLLVVGTKLPSGGFFGDAWVVKIDSRGRLEWQKEYSSIGDDILRDAVELPDGGYLVSGRVGVTHTPQEYQGWIMALDPQGQIRWQKGYNATYSDSLKALVPTADGIFGLGAAFQNAFFLGDAWVLHVDNDGNLLSSQLLGDFEDLGRDEFVDAKAIPGGGFIAVGTTETVLGAFFEQVWAVEFDNQGQPDWIHHYGGERFDLPSAMVVSEDGGLVFSGWTQWPDWSNDGLIMKVGRRDSGFLGCDRAGELTDEIFDFPTVVNVPTITVSVTDATLSRSNLKRRLSTTNVDLLCSD